MQKLCGGVKTELEVETSVHHMWALSRLNSAAWCVISSTCLMTVISHCDWQRGVLSAEGASQCVQGGDREDRKAEGNYAPRARQPQGEAPRSHHRRRQKEGRRCGGWWKDGEKEHLEDTEIKKIYSVLKEFVFKARCEVKSGANVTFRAVTRIYTELQILPAPTPDSF